MYYVVQLHKKFASPIVGILMDAVTVRRSAQRKRKAQSIVLGYLGSVVREVTSRDDRDVINYSQYRNQARPFED